MSHERLLLSSAFELHYALVDSYIRLNSALRTPDLSDEQRFLCYKNHLKNIQSVYEQVKEVVEEDESESTFCCFFKKNLHNLAHVILPPSMTSKICNCKKQGARN